MPTTRAERRLKMGKRINWAKIIEENREKILEKMIEGKKEAYSSCQGWHLDVEMDAEGNVWTTDLLSHGSQSMSSWKGETLVVCSIGTWDVDLDHDDYVKNDELLSSEYEAAKAAVEAEGGYLSAYDFVQETCPEKEAEWEQEERDWVIEAFEMDDADRILDESIECEKLRYSEEGW
jgi:hypothetical protein